MFNQGRCSYCGLPHSVEEQTCKQCGAPLTMSQTMPPTSGGAIGMPIKPMMHPGAYGGYTHHPPLFTPRLAQASLHERVALVDREIIKYTMQGYSLLDRASASARLVKVRRANGCLAALVSLLGVLPSMMYQIAARGSTVIDISVDPIGHVAVVQRQVW